MLTEPLGHLSVGAGLAPCCEPRRVGRDLPIPHGGPVRLRVETQLGYKSMKFLQRIVVTDTFDDGGKNGNIQNGWSWYAGI